MTRHPVPPVPYDAAVRLLSIRAGGPDGVALETVVNKYGLDEFAASAALDEAAALARRRR